MTAVGLSQTKSTSLKGVSFPLKAEVFWRGIETTRESGLSTTGFHLRADGVDGASSRHLGAKVWFPSKDHEQEEPSTQDVFGAKADINR